MALTGGGVRWPSEGEVLGREESNGCRHTIPQQVPCDLIPSEYITCGLQAATLGEYFYISPVYTLTIGIATNLM